MPYTTVSKQWLDGAACAFGGGPDVPPDTLPDEAAAEWRSGHAHGAAARIAAWERAQATPNPQDKWYKDGDGYVCDELDGGELCVFPNADGWDWSTSVQISVPYYSGFGDGGYDTEVHDDSGTADTLDAAQEAAERAYNEICGAGSDDWAVRAARDAGAWAYREDQPLTACPHPPGEAADAWRDGWQRAADYCAEQSQTGRLYATRADYSYSTSDICNAFDEGIAARRENAPIAACPYPQDDAAEAWIDGWQAEDQDKETADRASRNPLYVPW